MDPREQLEWQTAEVCARVEDYYSEQHGMCAHAALVLCLLLRADGWKAKVDCGYYRDGGELLPQRHAWVTVQGFICDPTRGQYGGDGELPALVYAPWEPGFEH